MNEFHRNIAERLCTDFTSAMLLTYIYIYIYVDIVLDVLDTSGESKNNIAKKWLLTGSCTPFAHRICLQTRIDYTMYFAKILKLTFPWVHFFKLKEHCYACIFNNLQSSTTLMKTKSH